MTDALFHVDAPPPPPPAEKLSADRRRTIRQAEALERGRHPLELVLGSPLRLHTEAAPAATRSAPGLRCGTCRFRELLGYHGHSFAKCTFTRTDRGYPRLSHSAATDVRAWWPACRDYQPAEVSTP